jgi:hypothetical protein
LLGPTAVRARVTDLVKYATDSSPYRLFPQVVVVAESADQITKTLQYAQQNHRSVTFRGSGSSLNGQSQGDDILIDERNCFAGIPIERVKSAWSMRHTLRTNHSCMLSMSCRAHKLALYQERRSAS